MAKGWAIGAGAALTAAAIAASQFIPDSEHAADAGQFRREYIEPIRQAMGGDCAAQTKAFTGYYAASRQLLLMGVDTDKIYGTPADYGIHNYDQKRSQTCADEALRHCRENHDFSKVRFLVQNIARTKEMLGDTTPDPASQEALKRCLTFELEADVYMDYGPGQLMMRGRAMIPVVLDGMTDETFVLRGDTMPTPDVQARPHIECRAGVTGVAAKAKMRVEEMQLHQDTAVSNALDRAHKKEMSALQAHVAARMTLDNLKKDKNSSPQDIHAAEEVVAAAAKALAEAEAENTATNRKYLGKNFNKPRQIDFLFDPGQIESVLVLYCPMGYTHKESMTQWYWGGVGAAFAKLVDQEQRMLRLSFAENEIQGGERFASKTYGPSEIEQLRGTIALKLWHRPQMPETAIAGNALH